MDSYTKFILTVIAVGVVGLNYHLFKNDIISPAFAGGGVQKVAICSKSGHDCVSTMDSKFHVKDD